MKRVRKGKREKVKDTKIYSKRWGSEGIRKGGKCPGPTRGMYVHKQNGLTYPRYFFIIIAVSNKRYQIRYRPTMTDTSLRFNAARSCSRRS